MKNKFLFQGRLSLFLIVVMMFILAPWLLKFDSLPHLVIGSINTLPKIIGLNIFSEALNGPTQGTLQIRTSMA